MSFKDKIISLLFDSPKQDAADEASVPEQEHTPQEAQEAAPEDPSCLELPLEHPIHQLLELWQKGDEALPPPQLYMDEGGILSPETLKREKSRLSASLNKVCAARLKALKGMAGGKHKKQGKPEEEAEADAPALDAQVWLYLSSDRLYAWMLVFPPVGQGAELSRDMIDQALGAQGISHGVETALLDRAVQEPDRYFRLYLAAKGTPAANGIDGSVVDCFPRGLQGLEANEFGQVDYTTLNLISNVEKGQEICRLIPPTAGEPGQTVTGQEIPAKAGRSVPLPRGRNTEISEDGLSLIASIPGHVEFSGSTFQIKPVMDIDGNVDFSTGSLKFVGDVNIKGDVLSGFTVKAMGNIYVGGMVEAGSAVEAGGDLTVAKGIMGNGSTVIRAGRNLFAKYIENATVLVREALQTDCLVNCKVYCDGEVTIRSGRGSIIGGQVWAARLVSASVIGAKSEVKTSVILGGQPCDTLEEELVSREVTELRAELEKLDAQHASPAKTSMMGKARMKLSMAESRLKALLEGLEAGKDDPKNQKELSGGRMECGVAYAGTEITIGREFLRLQHETHQCVAKLTDDGIVLV